MKKNIPYAVSHLLSADPVLARVIQRVPLPQWREENDYFKLLVESIINQQLSDKAANTIIGRFNQLLKNKAYKPQTMLLLPDQKIRDVGISFGKISYIKDLAQKITDKKLQLDKLNVLPDEEVITHLIHVKGIGRWTAEMFLMFGLRREDIFSYGDLGLRNAMQKLYQLSAHPTAAEAEKITAVWRPYRSWASRYLWASLDLADL